MPAIGANALVIEQRRCLRSACLIALLIAVGAAHAADATLAQLSKPLELAVYRPGTKPPQFAGQTFDARPLSVAALRGKVVVLNFWASWCHECAHEMRAFEQLHRDYSARGLAVVGINVRETGEAARRFARGLGTTLPLMLDPDGEINAAYGVIGVPTTFVIARDGRAFAFAVGARNWTSPAAKALIEALLAEPTPQ